MADITHILGGSWQPPEKRIDPPEVRLLDEIERSGIEPDLDHVVLDGNIHRFNTGGRKGKTGWYVAFLDGVPAGKFGCWRQDIEQTWRAETGKELTAADRMAHARRMDEAKKKRDEEKQKAHEIAEDVVAKIWEQAQPAADDHPYLKKKGVRAHGARITGDGRLIVPLWDAASNLISLQYIGHDSGKQYHGKGKTQGGHWVLGDIESDGEIYIAEGFATAATVHETTGRPCVIAYSAGNLTPVTGTICERYPGRSITIIADNDKGGIGKNHAEQAIAKYGVRYVMPPVKDMDANDWVQSGYDLNDILGQAEAEEWLEQVTPDWLSQPAPLKWIIKGWMPEQCLGMMQGASGAGKTFIMLDLLLHVATGATWNGHKTKPGCIVYLAGEGNYGLRSRIAAWAQHHGKTDIDMFVSKHGCDLNTPSGWNHAMKYLRRVAATHTILAICVDTLHRFLAGDENSAEAAKTMIDACDAMKRELAASVWLVHHTGLAHDAQDRGRGSSAWRGALDVEIGLRAPDGSKPGVIIQHKMKDAEAAPPQQFTLDSIGIDGWLDEDGEQVKSAVITWCGEYEAPHKQTSIEKAAKEFYSAWQALGAEYDGQGRPCVSAVRWRDWLIGQGKSVGRPVSKRTAENKTTPGRSETSHTLGYLMDQGKAVSGDIKGMFAFVDEELFAQYRSAGNILKG